MYLNDAILNKQSSLMFWNYNLLITNNVVNIYYKVFSILLIKKCFNIRRVITLIIYIYYKYCLLSAIS